MLDNSDGGGGERRLFSDDLIRDAWRNVGQIPFLVEQVRQIKTELNEIKRDLREERDWRLKMMGIFTAVVALLMAIQPIIIRWVEGLNK